METSTDALYCFLFFFSYFFFLMIRRPPGSTLFPYRRSSDLDWFHPGRSAVLSLGPKNPLAVFGELHPKVLTAMGVKGPAVAFTLFLENAPFPKAKTKARPALVISDYQAVERDFAFVVDADVEVEAVLKAASGAHKKLIESVKLFDVFHMDDNKKSVAISVRLQPTAGTLTDKEIDAISEQVIAKVSKNTGGLLRG